MTTDLERAAQQSHNGLTPTELADQLDSMAVTEWRWRPTAADLLKSAARYLRALSPAHPEGWVSVKDRLPDDGDMVIVFNGEICTVADYDPDPDLDCPWTDRIDGCARIEEEADVTHWMPLPSPPRAEGEQSAAPAGEQESTEAQGAPAMTPGRESKDEPAAPVPPLPEEPTWFARCRTNGDDFSTTEQHAVHYADALRQHAASLQAELAELNRLGYSENWRAWKAAERTVAEQAVMLKDTYEALDSLWAAIGDRLLANGPLDQAYAHRVLRDINDAKARIYVALAKERT